MWVRKSGSRLPEANDVLFNQLLATSILQGCDQIQASEMLLGQHCCSHHQRSSLDDQKILWQSVMKGISALGIDTGGYRGEFVGNWQGCQLPNGHITRWPFHALTCSKENPRIMPHCIWLIAWSTFSVGSHLQKWSWPYWA